MYTPTHCPDTGRKFTRAERKAANKAKFQAEQAKLRKSKPASKRKPKQASKPSPTQRVADRQERAHHGRPDGVVKPSKVKRTADVQATRELVRSVGTTNAKRRAFELATHWAYSPNFGGRFLPSQQEELTRLLGSTDVSTYEDVVALTL